jgi:hypothetical protein
MDGSGGSGGGSGGGSAPHPVLHASGGYWGGTQTSPGVYVATSDIYVGTKMSITIDDPGPGTTITWSGGTNYRSYLDVNLASASSANFVNMAVTTGVPTNGTGYSFIVDGNPRNYSIEVDVNYGAPGIGKSFFSFTSVAPAGASISAVNGGAEYIRGGTSVALAYDIPGPGGTNGIEFRATTPPGPLNSYGMRKMGISDYAFLQISEPQRNRTLANGTMDSWKDPANNGIAWYLDDGKAKTVAYPALSLSTNPTVPKAYGGVTWDDTNPSTVYARTNDGPTVSTLAIDKELDVNNEQFKMYLMFQPVDGVWIALSSLSWAWSGTASGGPDAWTGSASVTSPTVSPPPLAGGQEFPEWSGRGSQCIWTT